MTIPPLCNFNPRSRVGNDQSYNLTLNSSTDFNPRSRVGNDWDKGLPGQRYQISIHVPAWGTTTIPCRVVSTAYFNPRSRVGNDGFRLISLYQTDYFNPRSRVGNDHIRSYESVLYHQFQSTFPRGERQQRFQELIPKLIISIHVPAWGTTIRSRFYIFQNEFQSTFPRGERQYLTLRILSVSAFQSTFPRGERLSDSG